MELLDNISRLFGDDLKQTLKPAARLKIAASCFTPQLAKQIYRYLVKNDYTDDADRIAGAYHEAKKTGTLADLPEDLKG